jgi:hypothetical protein
MMMKQTIPPKAKLVSHAKDSAKAQQEAVEAFEKELQQLYDQYFLRVARFISKKDKSATDAINMNDATKVINDLSKILSDSGYEDVIADYLDRFPAVTKQALEYFEAFGVKPSLAGIDEEGLHALINFGRNELTSHIESALVGPVQSHLLQAAVGNVDRSELVNTILEMDPSTRNANVLVDDIYAQYQRAVTVQKAQVLDMKIYQYLGPDDAITSEQCDAMLHINKHGVEGMLYEDEITVGLHKNLTRNPLIGGGHPRCRHQWSPVTEDYAVSLGFVPRQQLQEAA